MRIDDDGPWVISRNGSLNDRFDGSLSPRMEEEKSFLPGTKGTLVVRRRANWEDEKCEGGAKCEG